MKLDRNEPDNMGVGKYALINMRRYRALEFFVIKLKDRAADDDLEWVTQVLALAFRAQHHPDKKMPD